MGAQIRVYRQKISSTTSMRKIFKAMELIATSRIGKARARVAASLPYANAITRAVSAVASQSEIDHPLVTEPEQIRRAAVLVITSDRGLAGSYSASVLKQAEGLTELLREEGKEVKTYLLGRKAQAYFDFRNRPYAQVWTGNTDAPEFATAQEIGAALLEDFATAYEEDGVDEIHVVYTRFKSMVTQEPTVIRLLPARGRRRGGASESDLLPLYEFEPEAGAGSRRPAAALHRITHLRRHVAGSSFRARSPSAGDEVRRRQRHGPHQEVHASAQHCPPG